MENKLLSVLIQDRGAYNNVKETIEKQDLSDIGQIFLEEIEDYYSADSEAEFIDPEIIMSRLERKHPEQSGTFGIVLEELAVPVSVPNVLAEYAEVRLYAMGRRIASALSSGDNSTEVQELISEYTFLAEKKEEALMDEQDDGIYIGIDDSFFEGLDPENLIHLYPQSLDERLNGGAPRGSHIVVYARPETGKSLFVINLAAGFLQQGLKVLYVGNEDPAVTMRNRIMSSLVGRTRDEIHADKDAYVTQSQHNGFNSLVFADLAPGSIADVRRLVHRHKPDVIIVDQIRNLHASKSLTKVEALEYIAQSMRNLAKEVNALGVSVTQAGDSADGKLALELGDVDFSKTGIPSTADVMIGIGVNHDYERTNRRMISLPKNKISGRHEHFPISVIPELSRCGDV